MCEQIGKHLEARCPRTLNEYPIARPDKAPEQLDGRRDIGGGKPLETGCLIEIGMREISHGDHHIDPYPSHQRTDGTMVLLAVGAKFCHWAEYGNATSLGGRLREQTKSGLHRAGIGVVRVVDDVDPTGQAARFATSALQWDAARTRRGSVQIEPKRARHGQRCSEVAGMVTANEVRLEGQNLAVDQDR